MATMCFEQPVPLAYEGDTPADCARKLVDAGADIVGVNCLNGPEQQLRIAVEMRDAVSTYLAAQPVAYRTTDDQPDFTATSSFPYGLDPLQLSRQEMAGYAQRARDTSINYIGSCCGSVHAHVRAMAKVLGKLPADEREWKSPTGKVMSAYEYREHSGPRADRGDVRNETRAALPEPGPGSAGLGSPGADLRELWSRVPGGVRVLPGVRGAPGSVWPPGGAQDRDRRLLRRHRFDRHGRAPRPESLRRVMSRYFAEMRTALERHGGTVEKFIGDAVMAVFGSRPSTRTMPSGPSAPRSRCRGPHRLEQGAGA